MVLMQIPLRLHPPSFSYILSLFHLTDSCRFTCEEGQDFPTIKIPSSFFFWPHCTACGIFIAQPGIEPVSPAVEVRSLNPWTTREVPRTLLNSSPHPVGLLPSSDPQTGLLLGLRLPLLFWLLQPGFHFRSFIFCSC